MLKSYFERKQSKADYSKTFEKNKNASTFFVFFVFCFVFCLFFCFVVVVVVAFFFGGGGFLVICISVRKNYRKPQMFGEHEKGAKYILKILEYISKILKVLKSWK